MGLRTKYQGNGYSFRGINPIKIVYLPLKRVSFYKDKKTAAIGKNNLLEFWTTIMRIEYVMIQL